MTKINTEKENQHYIPKFYLRYFSYNNNKKQIGIFNQRNNLYIPNAALKTQASKKYFYGKDGVIEDWLSSIESIVAPILLKMCTDNQFPEFMSSIQADLIFFIILLDLRNPIRLNQWEKGKELLKERILSKNPESKNSQLILALEELSNHEENVKRVISNTKGILPYCMDLKYKLLKNTTKIPFITSDYPLIKYNQFLEMRKWNIGGHNGYGTVGAQMFLPLNDTYTLILYDPIVYKVGNKKEKIVEINELKSIEQLNLLQHLNSQETLYFNHKASKHYIEYLNTVASKYKKANVSFSEIYQIDDGKGGFKKNEEVISLGSVDLKINLTLQKIKFSSKVRGIKLDNRVAQFRPKAEQIYRHEEKKKIAQHHVGEYGG